MTKKTIVYTLIVLILTGVIQSCANRYFRANYKDANSLIHATNNVLTKPFLKAHLKNGDVCIFRDSWKIDTTLNTVSGTASKFNYKRAKVYEGDISVAIDSVALFETNTKLNKPEAGRIVALSILTGINIAAGIVCLTNPKACFGSCPTFYMNAKDNFHYADAEGFSNAIVPSMEYFDIDALKNKTIVQNDFSITMKNEALETHCVNDVKLFAYPTKKGQRVYQTPTNDFYLCQKNYPLIEAIGNEGNITAILRNEDMKERFSLSDPKNLSSKEEIHLTFDSVEQANKLGLVLNFRQTLMTTFIFYNSMGYMGDEVGDFFAEMESNTQILEKMNGGIKKELGDIDIYVWNELEKQWLLQNGFFETGPIAINSQFIPIQNTSFKSKIKLKIVINKGLWRIDYVGLTNIKNKVQPIEISPNTIYNKGVLDNSALNAVNSPDKYLISMPGSEYTFNFKMPTSSTDYELFLYSKGYYLEWMRDHWLKDKDLLKLNQMVNHPKKYLRDEAKYYKKYEANMEQEFWNSKINTNSFSYYDK